ncbi:fumarylacetoacetate hydrolase family protein [Hydrogenophaga sp. 2FB]|uniref:fumarylacetoacetate hydrolase family protein n=1 Tax=Hydrogenophaga sp. 2FB TaxID=2502187 RepID=UPI0010F4CCB3|nr:fumarylacetoacetate hydrolase family protein [Hydrogenophaga sp. 2FB]
MNTSDSRLRLVHFSTVESNAIAPGLLVGEAVVDLREAGVASSLDDLFARWPEASEQLATLQGQTSLPGIPLSSATLRAPLPLSSTVYCAGANFRDHVEEMARLRGAAPEPPDSAPWHFIKPRRAALVGPGPVSRPKGCQQLDWEAELVAVIGRECRGTSPENALSFVAFYTIANDLSARDLFKRSSRPATNPFHLDWIGHKGFDGSCPIGPWLTSAEGIDPQQLQIRLWVDGALKQDSSTANMIFSTAEQIAHLSQRTTLFPGDVVLTGTPAGVGSGRNEFLAPGQRVSIEIDGLGRLNNTITEHRSMP